MKLPERPDAAAREAALLAHPAYRAWVANELKARKARAGLLKLLLRRAKRERSSLHEAAKAIIAELPEEQRDNGCTALGEVINKYQREMAERALWPAGNWPRDTSGRMWATLARKMGLG
jgi:hypothetical protein